LAGQGLEWLVTEALGPEHRDLIPRGVELFRAYYAQHSLDHTGLYPGMAETLDALAAKRVPLAVLSNKPDPATQQLMKQVFSRWEFAAIRGHRAGAPLKPDPAAALEIAAELAIPPERWVYVGDTKVDMMTARGAGMFAVGVLWGFREEAELRENGAQQIIRH